MTSAFHELVLVGRVVKPQGRHGEVAVLRLSDRPDRFPTMRRAFVAGEHGEPRELRVERAWPHKGRFVLKFEGVDSIDAAERLRGLELRIPEHELEPLPDGSYYHHQLAGMSVVDESGAALGTVEDVVETGAEARVLVVRGAQGELLLPFAAGFVKSVDLARGLLVVEQPEYLVAD
ncbi:MAG: ribosome maturation factor RimM [Betaproteobacteria bacterium]